VLVINDPARAGSLNSEPCPADCVVSAVSWVTGRWTPTTSGQMAATKHLPAVLLLDRDKGAWQRSLAEAG
jgi:hypothetical protein